MASVRSKLPKTRPRGIVMNSAHACRAAVALVLRERLRAMAEIGRIRGAQPAAYRGRSMLHMHLVAMHAAP